MQLTLTKDEAAYLLRLLGGPSDQGTRTLGVGLTGEGAIAFRRKVEESVMQMENGEMV